MKSKILLSLLSVMLLASSCSEQSSTTTISIAGLSDTQLYCLTPIDKLATIGFNDTINITCDTLVNLQSTYDKLHYAKFMSADYKYVVNTAVGEHFTIIINAKDSILPIRFDGRNAEGRDLYNKLSAEKDLYKYEWIRDFTKAPLDTSAKVMLANFKSIANQEITLFDILLQNKKIDKRFYDFVKADIELYYNTVVAKVITANRMNNRDNVANIYSDYMAVWKEIFKQTPITADIVPLSSFEPYTSIYIKIYTPFINSELQPTSYKEYTDGRVRDIQQEITDTIARRAYNAMWLYSQMLNNKTFSTDVARYMDTYIKEYPNSDLNAKFMAHQNTINDYHHKVSVEFSPAVKFIDKQQKMSTFKEVLAQFKGRKVFVDFWFSTCGPCVQEFEYNAELKKFLADNQVEILYVSIDRKEQQWHNSIKYYELDGNHILASQTLHEDIHKNYGVSSYPRYMIVNKKGEIAEPNARRPSQGEELYAQIKNVK